MVHFVLHNPASQAHLEDLKDRLTQSLLAAEPNRHNAPRAGAVIATLADLVRAMDQGAIGAAHVAEIFAAFRLPGFRFERWLADMVEEGVYIEPRRAQAA